MKRIFLLSLIILFILVVFKIPEYRELNSMKIIESIPIQKIHAFGETDDLICNFTVEEIKAPTYSIIHTMSRLWLVNSGCAKVLINNKE